MDVIDKINETNSKQVPYFFYIKKLFKIYACLLVKLLFSSRINGGRLNVIYFILWLQILFSSIWLSIWDYNNNGIVNLNV